MLHASELGVLEIISTFDSEHIGKGLQRQANTWQELNPGLTVPAVREGSQGVWSDAVDGFFIFAGSTGSAGPGPTNCAFCMARLSRERHVVLQSPGAITARSFASFLRFTINYI